MKIILANGVELAPIVVVGGSRYAQGKNRDCLSFIFPAEAGMAELDGLFTPENFESITIEEDNGGAFIHKFYTIRAELKKESVETVPATDDTEAVYEDRITVTMCQRTQLENQIASLTDTVDVLVMESLL